MPRQPLPDVSDADAQRLVENFASPDVASLTLADQLTLVRGLRAKSPELAKAVDHTLLTQISGLRRGLIEARDHLGELGAVLDKLSATPWYPAIFLQPVEAGDGSPAALIACNGSTRVVGLGDDVELDQLRPGDDVLLGRELNVIVRKSEAGLVRTGETAEFHHRLPDGRLVVRHRDDETVVTPAHSLDVDALSEGERVRWNRAIGMAFERIERPRESTLFIEDTPSDSFEQIGGLDRQIAQVQRSLRLHLLHPEIARRYHVRRTASILLVGPPGTGKTMMARALANWLGRHRPSGRTRFMAIKPGELHSMWYGQSEANYREAFRVARQAGDADPSTPVVMFFDEVDAIGRARGNAFAHVDDRVLTSFMTELDGLESRGNILVVGATNRRDTIDPALARPGRLGDLIIDIPRPDMSAAAAVFARHFPPAIPYACEEGEDETAARQRIIDVAVSRVYAPNGEGDLASIMFRDGTRRAITARHLMSGAHIANIARAAIERACYRDVEQGEPGLAVRDVLDAVADELLAAASALTPANCHTFIGDLPQDLAVVRVEPIVKPVRRPHRFMAVA